MTERLAAISVDLDSLQHYCRIQGLPETTLNADAHELAGTRAIPRFLELFETAKIPATFFVIGSDLSSPSLVRALKASHAAGVELANHSFSHDYGLSQRPAAAIEADLTQCESAMVAKLGVTPVGFRAPGYTLSAAMLEAVAARGYAYDSSAFPAAPYYLAKASVMGVLAAVGRPSRAMLDSPSVLLAPRVPYRPSLSKPYARGAAPFVELPMAVSPLVRMPFIGTFATSLPWVLVEATFRRLRHDELFNFELHAIDVLDETDGIAGELVAQQRDLKVPVAQKMKRLSKLFSWLAEDREAVTLQQAAQRLALTL